MGFKSNKYIALTSASMAFFALLGGCTVIESEKNVSGGYLGYLQDEYFMTVSTPEAEVYRALAVTTALALAAERNAVNHGNIKQAIEQLKGITDSLSALYSQATTPCGLPKGSLAEKIASYRSSQDSANPQIQSDCLIKKAYTRENKPDSEIKIPAYNVGFQIQLYRVNKQFFNLAAVSLPEDEFRSMITSATSGNFFGVLRDMLFLGREVVLTAAPAFAGARAAKQGRVHGFEEFNKTNDMVTSNQPQKDSIKNGSYREAVGILNSNSALISQMEYPTIEVMIGLFREVQQACVSIWSRLPAAHSKTIHCPREFIGFKLPLEGLYGGKEADKAWRESQAAN